MKFYLAAFLIIFTNEIYAENNNDEPESDKQITICISIPETDYLRLISGELPKPATLEEIPPNNLQEVK